MIFVEFVGPQLGEEAAVSLTVGVVELVHLIVDCCKVRVLGLVIYELVAALLHEDTTRSILHIKHLLGVCVFVGVERDGAGQGLGAAFGEAVAECVEADEGQH